MVQNFRQVRQPLSLKRWLIRLNEDLEAVEGKCTVRYWLSLSMLHRMIIVLEDKRYLRHRGIDWVSVARIAWQTIWGRRKGGASTIEMQLIRTILERREKTVGRKLNELLLAWLLNFRLDKVSIVFSYEQIAFFGSHLNGAKVAASRIFGKEPEELSIEEAAFLAAMLVYPRPNRETEEWRRKVERRARYGLAIYRRLEERGNKVTI